MSRKKSAKIHIRLFENLELLMRGLSTEQCCINGICTLQFVVKANGNIYPYDFYVLCKYCCGSINSLSVAEIAPGAAIAVF